MFNFENLVVWGVPWLGFVRAALDFIAWTGLKMPEKLDSSLFALLGAGGLVLSQNMAALYALWPPLETVGPQVVLFLAGFLFLGGHFKIQERVAGVQSRIHKAWALLDNEQNA